MAIHRYERHNNKKSRNYWTQDEFNKFLDTVNDRLDLRLAFVVSYWTGIRIQILFHMLQTINLVLYIPGWNPSENHIIILACQIGIHLLYYPVRKRN